MPLSNNQSESSNNQSETVKRLTASSVDFLQVLQVFRCTLVFFTLFAHTGFENRRNFYPIKPCFCDSTCGQIYQISIKFPTVKCPLGEGTVLREQRLGPFPYSTLKREVHCKLLYCKCPTFAAKSPPALSFFPIFC